MTSDPKSIKIRFTLDPREEQGFKTEGLWAEPVEGGHFQLRNSPFFVFGVSAEDVVSAVENDGVYEFRELVERGGHSTYRVFLQGGRTLKDRDFNDRWLPIKALGATYENGNDHFAAIDIPPGSDTERIYALLEAGEAEGIWTFEEGHYEPSAVDPNRNE